MWELWDLCETWYFWEREKNLWDILEKIENNQQTNFRGHEHLWVIIQIWENRWENYRAYEIILWAKWKHLTETNMRRCEIMWDMQNWGNWKGNEINRRVKNQYKESETEDEVTCKIYVTRYTTLRQKKIKLQSQRGISMKKNWYYQQRETPKDMKFLRT